MAISVRPLLFKPHCLNGLSDKLLVSHYENNYGGALPRLNAIEAKLQTLDWSSAPVFEINGTKREELIAAMQREPPVLLDVCLTDDLDRRSDMLEGAALQNPDTIDRWAQTLPRDRPIAVYCIYGFQVSGNTVAELRRRGHNARSLKGGIAAWHAIGGRTVPLDRGGYDR